MKKKLYGLTAGVLFWMIASSASATPLLVNGDFDDDMGLTGTAWKVYDSILGWTKGDGTSGIEVQQNTIVTAQSGDQYVELDSNGGVDTNSSMYQTVFLDAGEYTLDWWYHARTNNGSDDNGIEAYLSDLNNVWTFNIGSVSSKASEQSDVWEQISWTFTITSSDTYNLWFAAYGLDNSLGGFVDSVSLTATEVPEPATMFLFGAGLAGLFGVTRRKK
jgi:hypothetical protein